MVVVKCIGLKWGKYCKTTAHFIVNANGSKEIYIFLHLLLALEQCAEW